MVGWQVARSALQKAQEELEKRRAEKKAIKEKEVSVLCTYCMYFTSIPCSARDPPPPAGR
jgi:hypothetical protein